MTRIDEAISSYVTALKIEGKAPKTIISYANSLDAFRREGRRQGMPDAIGDYEVEHVYAFLGALREAGASPGYQHRRHREVQTLFSWCERMRIVDRNVFKQVPRVKVPEKLKPPFSPDEVRLLLNSRDTSLPKGCRDHALILFLLDTGVRVSECISIQLDEVDWDRNRVFVAHGKGQKQRWVGLGDKAALALRDYITRFRGDADGALFLSSTGEALSTGNSVRIILKRIGAAVGVANVHPHRFRHTFATWAIQSGAREIDVQMLLGHADLTMTQRYARTYSSEQAVQAHTSLSPVAQLEPKPEPEVAPGVVPARPVEDIPPLPRSVEVEPHTAPSSPQPPLTSEAAVAPIEVASKTLWGAIIRSGQCSPRFSVSRARRQSPGPNTRAPQPRSPSDRLAESFRTNGSRRTSLASEPWRGKTPSGSPTPAFLSDDDVAPIRRGETSSLLRRWSFATLRLRTDPADVHRRY